MNSKKSVRMYSFMLGYNAGEDALAYLKIREAGSPYELVGSAEDATLFENKNYRRRRGWAPPADWAEFFSGEPELEGWKFKAVGSSFKPKGNSNGTA